MTHPTADLYGLPLTGQWIKSSYSNGNGSDCVQLMKLPGGVALGDSKAPERAPLRYPTADMASFLAAAKAGEFDHLLED